MRNDFIKKGYGRIYVFNKDKVQDVIEAIKMVDESELFYMPENLVVPYDGEIELIYTHKFEIDIHHTPFLISSNIMYYHPKHLYTLHL
jgi:hypothetical protein